MLENRYVFTQPPKIQRRQRAPVLVDCGESPLFWDKWRDLFGAKFEVLLYDLTSTYFEIDAPDPQTTKKRFGYSRDKRPDCVQVVIALVVTPEGFPLAYKRELFGHLTEARILSCVR